MFLPDPKTLSLLIGIANLIFALLATIYIANSKGKHPALEVWRWGRLMAGSGYLLNLVSSVSPQWIHPVTGHLLQLGGGGCDIAAYALLLGRGQWLRPLKWAVGFGVVSLLLVSVVSPSQHPRLLLFSVFAVIVYAVLVRLIWYKNAGNGLRRLIGFIDSVLLVVLLLRVGKGLMVGPLVRFDQDLLTVMLYLTVYLVLIINGFGFLLLVKQQADRALHDAFDQLGQADEDRRQLLAMASHEFRTPVAKIKAALDSLRFLPDSQTPQISGRLTNIRLASQRLTDLANTLLTYERLQQPGLPGLREQVDLVELCQGIRASYPQSTPLRLEMPAGPVVAKVDATQIRIALQNLVDNAIEHSGLADTGQLTSLAPEGDNPAVCLFLCQGAEGIELGVSDQGQGVPEADIPLIFEPFRNPRGDLLRGVGLSIVRQVARSHGGDAYLKSNTPQGTVIFLKIPLE